jgi:cytochrome c biogenesis protein CcdA
VKIAITGGLIDGINPCAFAVMVFLVSFLSAKKYSFRHIWVFILGVFVLYFLLGVGGYYLLEKIITPKIAGITTRIIAFLIIILGLVHIFENPYKSRLVLPKQERRFIHSLIIRTGLSSKSFFSFFGLGVVVAFLESACTGQVYLPVIYSFVALGYKRSILYLFVYNICFVLPLILVGWLSISFKEKIIKNWDERYIKKFKMVMGLFLVILGIFLMRKGCVNCEKASFISGAFFGV